MGGEASAVGWNHRLSCFRSFDSLAHKCVPSENTLDVGVSFYALVEALFESTIGKFLGFNTPGSTDTIKLIEADFLLAPGWNGRDTTCSTWHVHHWRAALAALVGNVRNVDHVEWILSVLEANNERVTDLQVAGDNAYFWVEEVETCELCKAVFKNCWVVFDFHQWNVVCW